MRIGIVFENNKLKHQEGLKLPKQLQGDSIFYVICNVKALDFKQKKLFTLQKDATVSQCAKIMKKHRISVVIITNKENELHGVVTKTDLVSIFLTKSSKQFKISEIMRKQVISATPSDLILHVEKLLLKYGISRVVIKRNQRPVGIITFRDFVPAKIPQWIAKNADPREVQEYKWKKSLEEIHSNEISYLFPFQASDIMSENLITVEHDAEIRKVITLMIKYNISGLPVIKKSRLVGIITKSDIVKISSVGSDSEMRKICDQILMRMKNE